MSKLTNNFHQNGSSFTSLVSNPVIMATLAHGLLPVELTDFISKSTTLPQTSLKHILTLGLANTHELIVHRTRTIQDANQLLYVKRPWLLESHLWLQGLSHTVPADSPDNSEQPPSPFEEDENETPFIAREMDCDACELDLC